ncbi:UDP-4-amino-4,6-dideoxy-N-acetyl-beta-L-altrosamine transaminase [Flavobacterium salilacus subsp. salilacus]|uniref:UDP-4-amino-4, 6-dideoxy-N-acetyl-beta-L-altrosamine transaminase n=1 Tax=Flavobacterium TaxID=237 RepID=UPI001075596A|nr:MULTISPECIES: UDP-4-amino-4,6-dideoxy-N-acetyl-beta-L-altrosamine transaminase [Flavobacterium]KAF2519780.1 UDP-4-amino-4,6-dideoxy-N-acetyl-beta-L-altrosamine transaminase [Flavobacterium salilacus subsp. salilacus]MBE1614321.1 UDP-4-amino-4,6-dideoxy-N-acetyl-beta-L-altrosamine transaminase [Flavobacterium sp. SaA2.13]NDI97595.1 UDP-4-amino-4,6-dideoxy-N-acetyl-beta-L-altrosamine transaminase [Flavobacterium salilacus subsp. altitudinum]
MQQNPIPYGRQNITDEDIATVIETLKSDYLTQGPKIKEFEDAFADYVGAKYAVALANGTAALHLCAMALNVQEGDKVITTPITFAASANCIRYCGGEVVFSDIDPDTYLLDFEKVKQLVESSPKGTYKGIIPVDFAGRAVNLEKFRALADEYGMWIIEDACHAPGGYFIDSANKEQLCGNGNYANLAIFSFHPVKHIASGEGGMITTNDEELYKKLMVLRTHGITRDTDAFKNSANFAAGAENQENYPAWYMEMQVLGYNYRLTDIQAALGLSQMKRADEGVERRRKIAARYYDAFRDMPFIKGQSESIEGHAYHLYIIETENRIGLYNFLRENKIFAQVHYIPCHLMPYYQSQGWKENDMPKAEEYYKNCLSLPMYPTLTDEEQEYVINKVKAFYGL